MSSSMEIAAKKILDEVEDDFLIALGSGSSVTKFVEVLGDSNLKVSVIPSSYQIRLKAEEYGLTMSHLNSTSNIDLDVDGADQIDSQLRMIKGGGGALLKEKVLMRASKKTIIMASEDKFVEQLNGSVPIEVIPFAKNLTFKILRTLAGNPKMRITTKDYPYFTENGNMIFDTDFGIINDPKKLCGTIKLIPGVVECGLFTETIDSIYLTGAHGSVKRIPASIKN